MKTYTREELRIIADKHDKWHRGEAGGLHANLADAYLYGAHLARANLADAYLYGAHLTGANLTGADLTIANLTGADLTGADLTGANLTGANLTGANLTSANLTSADLTSADLTGANLTGANLTSANLTSADLTSADLTDADLKRVDLEAIKADIYEILDAAPGEVPALLSALREGRIAGSCYSGECACLVGTIAHARGVHYTELPGIVPNWCRPAEMWLMGVKPGHRPETHLIASITASWIEQWLIDHSTNRGSNDHAK